MYYPERPNLETIAPAELTLPEWTSVFSTYLTLNFQNTWNLLILSQSILTALPSQNGFETPNDFDPSLLVTLDPAERTLSEMGLCSSLIQLKEFPPLPEEVEVVHGSVFVVGDVTDNNGNKDIKSHWFFRIRQDLNPEHDLIGCLTAGQFIAADQHRKPGERLGFLQEQTVKIGLPGLLTQITPEISLLLGTRAQLRQLGLSYMDFPQPATTRPTGGIRRIT